ncbi:MAG: adenine-specific methyltransferase EcoRI family protein [Gammaproteobacteria bacterium]
MPARTTQNRSLDRARAAKNDEFYTQLSDIEREVGHYSPHFRGKTVLCNCDDPWVSKFFDYFARNFEFLKLRKLVTTCYQNQRPDVFSSHDSENGARLEYHGDLNNNRVPDPDEIGVQILRGDGDFRSEECVELLRNADVVVTNPPFSLFRDYVAQLVAHDKKFLIVGHQNACTYKEIFKLIKENKIWLGYGFKGGAAHFINVSYEDYAVASDHKEGMIRVSGVHWFTNLDTQKRHEDLVLYKTYNPGEYPQYDNYDAINVDKVKEIPADYAGAMGVPVTFLNKYNPDQFEIIGMAEDNGRGYSGGVWMGGSLKCLINGEAKFKRVFIKHKRL